MKRKAILALSVLFVSVMRPAIADVGSAETLLPIAKISPELMAKVASEGPHDLIVVFDDTAVKQQTETFRTTLRAPLNDQATLDLTAAKLADAKSAVLSAFSSDDVVVLREYSHLSISHIRVQSSQALDKLLAHPGVTGIYENKVLYRAGLAQSLPLIKQPQAAAAGDQGTGATVAVLDTRVDYGNSAFGSCSAPGVPGCKVLIAQDAPGMANDGLGTQDGHGTNVAATILAVAPGGRIISLNVFKGASTLSTDVISAINWCVANASNYNIVAMNLSLGFPGGDATPTSSSAFYPPFVSARAAGILPVAAAGNSGLTGAIAQPASVVGAVSVGAVYDSELGPYQWPETPACTDQTTAADKVTCFSNSASFLTLLAPGCRDDAAGIGFCGTSQATPHVAGAVAVLRSAFPSETLNQTVARLQNGVSVTDSRNGVTRPRLDLAQALGLSACSFTVSPATVSVGADAGSRSISITAGTGCSWSATTNTNWITVTSGGAGTGSGTVQLYLAANGNASVRTGSLSVAGQTVIVTQAAGAANLSSTTNVWLIGNYSYQTHAAGISPTSVTLAADSVLNSSVTMTTGTLRLELWLSNAPFTSTGGTGWQIATDSISIAASPNGTLGPGQFFYDLSATVPIANLPAPGSYYANFLVTEYEPAVCSLNGGFCIVAFGGFPNKFFIADVTAPTTPTGLIATPAGVSQINLTWNSSSDNVAVASYKVFQSGVLLGSVATPSASVVSLSPLTTYQFSVSGCDAAGNCSPQSASASATTLGVSTVIPTSGLWAIDSENNGQSGRGFQVETHNGTTVFTYYGYRTGGHDHWYLAAGALVGGSFSSAMTQYHGGTALGGSSSPATANGSPGSVSMTFASPTSGTITLPGESAKTMSKFVFTGSGVPSVVPSDGLWVVNAENNGQPGRGFQIEQHAGLLVFTYYGYDATGQETWYLAAGAMSGSTFTGILTEYGGGTILGGTYSPSTSTGSAGTVTLSFTSSTTGTIALPGESAKAISKFSW